jgi:hypothetical protein
MGNKKEIKIYDLFTKIAGNIRDNTKENMMRYPNSIIKSRKFLTTG